MNKVWYQSIAYNVGFQIKKDYNEWMDIMKVIAKSKRGANLGHTVILFVKMSLLYCNQAKTAFTLCRCAP